MIPENTFTPEPDVSDFLPPNDGTYSPLTQTVRGGLALGDNSLGRNSQNWTVEYIQDLVSVKSSDNVVRFTLPVTGALSVSLAFDTAMRVVLTWTTLTDAYLYYYDTLTSNYITVAYSGVTSSRVTVDKYEDFFTASSDVIFAYVKNDKLYYRQQRDRYGVERFIKDLTEANILIKVGPNKGNRLQFKLVNKINSVPYLGILNLPVELGSDCFSLINTPKYIVLPTVDRVHSYTSILYPIQIEDTLSVSQTNLLKSSIIELPVDNLNVAQTEITSVTLIDTIVYKAVNSNPSNANIDSLNVNQVLLTTASLADTIVYKTVNSNLSNIAIDTVNVQQVTVTSASLIATIAYVSYTQTPLELDNFSVNQTLLISGTLE